MLAPDVGQEGADRGDQTGSVVAVQQQPADVVDRKLSLVDRGKPAGGSATSATPRAAHAWQDRVHAAQLPAHSRGLRLRRAATTKRAPCHEPAATVPTAPSTQTISDQQAGLSRRRRARPTPPAASMTAAANWVGATRAANLVGEVGVARPRQRPQPERRRYDGRAQAQHTGNQHGATLRGRRSAGAVGVAGLQLAGGAARRAGRGSARPGRPARSARRRHRRRVGDPEAVDDGVGRVGGGDAWLTAVVTDNVTRYLSGRRWRSRAGARC